MGRSFSRLTDGEMRKGSYYHRASGQHFTMLVREGRYYQRRHQTGPHNEPENILEKAVDYVLGSGNHSRSYLHRASSGKLILLPLAWYSERKGFWAMSPGYDRANHFGFRRNISYDCMFCHNGYPAGMEKARVGDDPAFPENLPEGIDCQRCHGPGKAHVEAAADRKPVDQIRAEIVNPKRLGRDRNLEVCMQCHLETTSRPLPYSVVRYDRGFFSYSPGQPLSGYMLHFDQAPGGEEDRFEIAHAAYRLRKSACFRRSDGLLSNRSQNGAGRGTAERDCLATSRAATALCGLTCTTCHNPHDALRGAKAASHYRQICQSCHPSAHRSAEDCTSCHMPKRRTDDVIHVVMTDHWIQRRRPDRNLLAPLQERHDSAATAYRGEVAPYYPTPLDDELYLAVAQVDEGSNLSGGIPRLSAAIERLRPTEAMFYVELADAYWKAGDQYQALAAYEAALARKGDLLPVIRNFSAALLESGQLERAAEVLARAPNDPGSLAGLGDVYRRQGRSDAAAQSYRAAIARDPDMAEAHHGLAQVLLVTGKTSEAADSFREAIRIRPDYADAHYNLGTTLGQQGDLEGAARHLLLALRANPRLAGAYNNLGMVAAARGDLRQAIARFRQALEIDPTHEDARANLERAMAGVR
jgi:tetratricopeptide (TPR) repeat protein